MSQDAQAPSDGSPPQKKSKVIGLVVGDSDAEPVPQPKPGDSIEAKIVFQSDKVHRSLVADGKVYTKRDTTGSDDAYIGCDFVPLPTLVTNGRGKAYSLDEHGFAMVADANPITASVDFYDEDQIIRDYYPACAELVKRTTGASRVFCFDHNLRCQAQSKEKTTLKGGNQVQGPAFVAHNDYTKVSAQRRVKDLTLPPKVNDTMRKVLGDTPLVDAEGAEYLRTGRWVLVNVWRNIKAVPVQKFPLAVSTGVALGDLVTFEIHYADRIGENFFLGKSAGQEWVYFPEITRDEAILLKVWDTAGAAFADQPSGGTVPATFSCHTAFEDPSSRKDADERASIEVRTLAFLPDVPASSRSRM